MVEQHPTDGALPMPRRRWLRTVLLGIVILLCGIVIGGALTLRFRWPRLLLAREPWERMPEHIAERMRAELGLTEEQEAQIEVILARHHGAMDSIRLEVQPRVEARIDSMRREINALLTPQQAAQWSEHFERMRHHGPRGESRRRPGFPGHRGGPPPEPPSPRGD
jgi:Spy/CpxP family protein refolding chaperone